MISGVTVEGLAEAKKKLTKLTPKQMRAVERNSLRAGGQLLAKRAKARAPMRTGRLRKRGVTVSVSVSMSAAEVNVGTGRIGLFNELGTKRMQAQPFMRPALDESQDEIIEAYGEAVKRWVEKLS